MTGFVALQAVPAGERPAAGRAATGLHGGIKPPNSARVHLDLGKRRPGGEVDNSLAEIHRFRMLESSGPHSGKRPPSFTEEHNRMNFSYRLTQYVLSAVVLASSAACGGGGSSNDTAASGSSTTGTGQETSGGNTQTGTSVAAPLTVATEYAPGVYLINPGATWKPLNSPGDAHSGAVVYVPLANIAPAGTVVAGSVLEVQAFGSYSFDISSSTAAPSANATAVFYDASGAMVARGASSTVVDARETAACGVTAATDPFVGDFAIPLTAPARVQVPAGATQIRLSVDDCKFQDNGATAGNPIRVSIRVAPAA